MSFSNRKSMTVIVVSLLIVAAALSGCKRGNGANLV